MNRDYFLERYRTAEIEDLQSAARLDLVPAAAEALRAAITERGLNINIEQDASSAPASAPLNEDIAFMLQQSGALWRGPISQMVQLNASLTLAIFGLCVYHGFSLAWGALPFFLIMGALAFLGHRLGRQFTRGICSRIDLPYTAKVAKLKRARLLSFPSVLLGALAGVAVVMLLRG